MLTMPSAPGLSMNLGPQTSVVATKKARTKVRAKSGLFSIKYAATGCSAAPAI